MGRWSDLMTRVFVEQPQVLPGSAKHYRYIFFTESTPRPIQFISCEVRLFVMNMMLCHQPGPRTTWTADLCSKIVLLKFQN